MLATTIPLIDHNFILRVRVKKYAFFDESSFMHGNYQEKWGDTVTLCPPTLKSEGDVYPLSPVICAPDTVQCTSVLCQTEK